LGVGTSHGHFYTQDSSRPGLGGSHHLPPYSILAALCRSYIQMALFPETPKLESQNCLGLESRDFWAAIAPRPELGSGRALNQSCSSCQELSNAVSHSLRQLREEVDSRLLVVGSQTDNLTPDPSFAHNLGCRCPNGQCETILDIYASRPFH